MQHSRQKGTFVTPKAVLSLMDRIGPTKAARNLGISPTTLYKARRSGEVSKVYEVAAAGILGISKPMAAVHAIREAHEERPEEPRVERRVEERELLMIEIPKSKEDIVRRAVTLLGGELVH